MTEAVSHLPVVRTDKKNQVNRKKPRITSAFFVFRKLAFRKVHCKKQTDSVFKFTPFVSVRRNSTIILSELQANETLCNYSDTKHLSNIFLLNHDR